MIPVTALYNALKSDILGHYPDLGPASAEMWDPLRYAAARQLGDFLKKQQETIDQATADATALKNFLMFNERARGFNIAERRVSEAEEELYGTFKRYVYEFFYPRGEPLFKDWGQVVSNGDLGNGANQRATSTAYYSKLFDSDLSVTDVALYDLYKQTISKDPKWAEAEQSRRDSGYRVVICKQGLLGFVPKNVDTSRTIETHATLNMFLQRGCSKIIESRLRDFGVDLALQPDRNRELARIGSESSAFSTLDLRSASDLVSLSLCRDSIPRNPLSFLMAVRTSHTQLPDGTSVELGMMGTMGNGYTFALQTVIFMCIIHASMHCAGVSRYSAHGDRTQKNWGIFGDDIVVPTGKATRLCLRLLDICGFVTNVEKSFVEGPFRESCGRDYLYGVNCRPVYAKTWTTRASRYSLVNNLNSWSARTGLQLPALTSLLQTSLLRPNRAGKAVMPHIVPPSWPESSGIRVPYSLARTLLERDANGALITHYLAPVPCGIKIEGDTITRTLQPKTGRRKKLPDPCFNSAGLLISFVRGSVRGLPGMAGFIGFRSESECRYGTRSAHVPNWDWTGNGAPWQEPPGDWDIPAYFKQ